MSTVPVLVISAIAEDEKLYSSVCAFVCVCFPQWLARGTATMDASIRYEADSDLALSASLCFVYKHTHTHTHWCAHTPTHTHAHTYWNERSISCHTTGLPKKPELIDLTQLYCRLRWRRDIWQRLTAHTHTNIHTYTYRYIYEEKISFLCASCSKIQNQKIQQFCNYLLWLLSHTHLHTLVWTWHGRSAGG